MNIILDGFALNLPPEGVLNLAIEDFKRDPDLAQVA